MPTYPGISSTAFRHPLDIQAEQALRSVPGFDLVARKFVEFVYERPRQVFLTGNAIEVGPRQYASIYQIFREAVRDLDLTSEPTLFVAQSPDANAYALGQERPSMVLSSGLLDLMEADQLRSVIAHELGHIKCGHNTLNQMALWAINLVFGLAGATFGLSSLVSTGLISAFYEWMRKAELSADRAALLVIDDLNPIFHAMMRVSGGSLRYANELSLEEFIRQSDRYQQLDQDGLNQVYKLLLYNNMGSGGALSHPFTVERVKYLQDWANSEDYRQIKAGNYRRTAEGAVNVPPQSSSASANPSANPSGQPPTSQVDESEVDRLRREIESLQQAIDEIKRTQEP